jgi:uncharacterized protein (DUF433 family)
MLAHHEDILEVPIYGALDAAHYLRVPYQTLRYWIRGSGSIEPIIKPAETSPPRLSFMNLMECHMLSAMRTHYNLRLPKVRKALRTLATMFPTPHPLVNRDFETDDVDVFIREHGNELINLNRPEQMGFRELLEMHMRRIERTATGIPMFFPFIEKRSLDEPKSIMISPAIAFGRPVISGTGISTAVIASRFHARESVGDLAKEYGRTDKEIEEAIRWESRAIAA